MLPASLLFVSALAFAPLAVTGALPQGFGAPAGSTRGAPQPGGGVPEPTVILLLAGGALGYGAYRFKQRAGGSDAGRDNPERKDR